MQLGVGLVFSSCMWSEFCPAKLNLYLAVTRRREDGFHDLVSVVVKTSLGDTLEARLSEGECDTLACSDEALSCGPDNLVLKAAAAYRAEVSDAPFLSFNLVKRVPYGAGLGGGSSDAAAALRIMNRACSERLDIEALRGLAARVGSDCPLFLMDGAVVMRGRGDVLTPVPAASQKCFEGRGVIIVKPHFGIATGWAYSSLASAGALIDPVVADAEIADWLMRDSLPPLRNSFQTLVYDKYPCYEVLNARFAQLGLPVLSLTGSGSAAFAFCSSLEADGMQGIVRESFGKGAFVQYADII